MQDFPLRLPMESTIGRTGQEASCRLVNGYTEALGIDKDGKSQFAVYARPGLNRFSQGSAAATARVMVLLSDTALIAVLGAQITSFNVNGAATILANLAGTDRITAALNENATPQLALVTDGGTYALLSAGSLSTPSTSFAAPNSVAFLKGLFIFTTAAGQIFHSALNDGTTFNALAFDYANSEPHALVRGIADAGYYYVFSTGHMEIWQDVGTSPFALTPLQQYIPMGLLAKYSLTKGAANGLLFVDHRGIVRYGRDGGAQRISTHTVERAIEELPDADRANLVGSYFVAQGHEFYVLHAPSQFTWAYDLGAMRWYEWNSAGQNRWIGNDAILFNNHWIVCDYRNGVLYQASADAFGDAGNDFVLELWCPHVHAFRNSIAADMLDIDLASGVGNPAAPDPADVAPQIQIAFSEDGGKLFTGERLVSFGAAGDRRRLIRTGRWGRITPKGRIWKIRASSMVLRALFQAVVRGRPLAS